jgi:exosortase A-associated hydrolase 2
MAEEVTHNIESFFLPFRQDSLFCIFLTPSKEKARAAILYVHPFAEEMHKSRRMAALQARYFAQAGYAVLQIDLLGCGDSSGDFADARWDTWLENAQLAYDWLQQKTKLPIVVWGLRLGATLAAELSTRIPQVAGLLLWQPVVNGENFLTQFLRIKVASELFGGGKTGVKELREQLANEQAVEVGGYSLAPALAAGLDSLRLALLNVQTPTYWFEISPNPTDLSPASSKVVDTWRASNPHVVTQTIAGDAFWVSQEITECPALLAESIQALNKLLP